MIGSFAQLLSLVLLAGPAFGLSHGQQGAGHLTKRGPTTSSQAMFYYQNGKTGACGWKSEDYDYAIGLPEDIYKQHCGKLIRVLSPVTGQSVIVKVADSAGEADGVILSTGAWDGLGVAREVGITNVEWSFVDVVGSAKPKQAVAVVTTSQAPAKQTTTTTSSVEKNTTTQAAEKTTTEAVEAEPTTIAKLTTTIRTTTTTTQKVTTTTTQKATTTTTSKVANPSPNAKLADSSDSYASGKGLVGFRSSNCGPSGASEEFPNGDISWLNCGIDKSKPGSGWVPPAGVDIHSLKTVSISDAIASNHVWDNCKPFVKLFEKYGKKHDLPPILLAAIALQESTCQPWVLGDNGGAFGLMQITEDKCGGRNTAGCTDPDYNIDTGAAYLAAEIKRANGNFLTALGQYNGWTPGMSFRSATAAANGGCCVCQNNLDYLHQMLNGWLLGKTGYAMKIYDNLAVCGKHWEK